MSSRFGSQIKVRHYRNGPDGLPYLIWAQSGEHGYDNFELGSVPRGSTIDLEVKRDAIWTPNALVDEGEKSILDVYLDDVAVITTTYFRLYSDGAIAETDTLATLTSETSGTSYDGIAVTRNTDWPDPTLDGGDMQTTSAVKQFTAGGTWTDADELVWATVQNGTAGLFLGFVALSTTRQLENTDTLDVSLAVKLA